MNTMIVDHGIFLTQPVRELITRKETKIEQILASFHPESLNLHIDFNRITKKGIYEVKMSLDVPGKTIVAKTNHVSMMGAFGDAFQKLSREIEYYKADMRKKNDYESLKDVLSPQMYVEEEITA